MNKKKQNEIMIGKRDKNCDNAVIYIRIQPAYTHIHIFISLWYNSIWDASPKTKGMIVGCYRNLKGSTCSAMWNKKQKANKEKETKQNVTRNLNKELKKTKHTQRVEEQKKNGKRKLVVSAFQIFSTVGQSCPKLQRIVLSS